MQALLKSMSFVFSLFLFCGSPALADFDFNRDCVMSIGDTDCDMADMVQWNGDYYSWCSVQFMYRNIETGEIGQDFIRTSHETEMSFPSQALALFTFGLGAAPSAMANQASSYAGASSEINGVVEKLEALKCD